ncbi:MAG TPA: N-acetylneuraminate synthase [Pyrinomonadaceae bacterium]|jgi:N-acetylneuraminate synthase|nr:N-acetylneuraminate synthase [Pyrinomonadaceae bacterium]
MTSKIQIGERMIGDGEPVLIIAEAGVNHNGQLEKALELVSVARAAGADAVKFQLYRPEEQVSQAARTAGYQREQTGADHMLEMARSYELPWEAHHAIAARCREAGIAYMSSCFDREAVDFLVQLGGECIKVGSGEITNYPLLAHMSATGLPILLSTGMSTLSDVAGAVEHIHASGPGSLALFQCVSNYPADPATVNLRAMLTMRQAFNVPVGFSDHTHGSAVAVAAVALGACMVEKHFTLDKSLPGPDHAMSLDPSELRAYVKAIRTAESALGDGIKRPVESELETLRAARRSLVSARIIHAGESLDESNVTLKRPATGIDPRLWQTVRGRVAATDIPPDVPITWKMLS